jgi:NAD-dependent deacetylase
MRGCAPVVRPLPDPLPAGALRCGCGERLRPHVLWFDESYDEPLYRYVSALRAAQAAAALIVVGTSGATTLPARMCEVVAARGAPLVVVDVEPTPFSQLAIASRRGLFLRGAASDLVPALAVQIV